MNLLDQLIRDGLVADQAELARLGHVNRNEMGACRRTTMLAENRSSTPPPSAVVPPQRLAAGGISHPATARLAPMFVALVAGCFLLCIAPPVVLICHWRRQTPLAALRVSRPVSLGWRGVFACVQPCPLH